MHIGVFGIVGTATESLSVLVELVLRTPVQAVSFICVTGDSNAKTAVGREVPQEARNSFRTWQLLITPMRGK